MTEIVLIVAGPVGCGKSAIAGEIEIALKAIGVAVRFADEKAWASEKRLTHADWAGDLEMYKPSVVVVEQIQAARQIEEKVGGGYEMPDGRKFWVDGPVAREIAQRVLGLSRSSNQRRSL